MKVLNDVIAVKRREANTLIHMVDHKEHIGEVIAVGPGKTRVVKDKTVFIPNTLEVGDNIMFSFRAGMETDVNGDQVLFMREADVLCVLDPNEVTMTDNAAEEKNRECVGVISV